jgi:ubiquinone biosynthesis monooxygenase Coq7
MMRNPRIFDPFIIHVDAALRTLASPSQRFGVRKSPAEGIPESAMSLTEKQHVAGLMRVNHAGEVCAQALYQGQALTARLNTVKEQMAHAAAEEIDHLAWCEARLSELNSHPSLFNPLWYAGSFFLGALAGLVGDQWSLGFVAETERQVTAHLTHHLARLPPHDEKTKAILLRMKMDETAHADLAVTAGARALPVLIKNLMYGISKLLTTSSYVL